MTRSAELKVIRSMKDRFTSNPAVLGECALIVVAVPTPITCDCQPDLGALRAAARTIGRNVRRGTLIVVESTVYPGVTEDEVGAIISEESGLYPSIGFHLGYSPERINPGDEVHTLERLVKVVAGESTNVTSLMADVYGKVTGGQIHQSATIRTAEAAKVLENTQRDLNIALMNELAMICDRLDLDTQDVIRTASTKWNFAHYKPGLVGGHCIGVDPYYLTFAAQQAGYHAQVILAGRQTNASMGSFVAKRAAELLGNGGGPIEGASALILGFTFKENIPDVRNTRVIDIIDTLNELGIVCSVYDPEADKSDVQASYRVTLLGDPQDRIPYDIIIVAVEHDQIRDKFNLAKLKSIANQERSVLMDVKRMYERKSAERAGFIYWGL